MTGKAAFLTLCILEILLMAGAYIQRGELTVGAECFIPLILAAIIPLRERREE